MQSAIHLQSKVLPGNRIEVTAPDLEEGQTVDLIIVPSGASVTPPMRQAFLRLPLEERRRILTQQADAMLSHYEQDTEWRELQNGDIVEY